MKKIQINAAKLQLNKTRIADLNTEAMQAIQGGVDSAIGNDTSKVIVRPIRSSPYYVTCLNCNPQTNSISCCDGV